MATLFVFSLAVFVVVDSHEKSKVPEEVARFAAFSNIDVLKTFKASYRNDKMDFEEIEGYSEGLYLDVQA